MKIKLKWIVAIETFTILFLLIFLMSRNKSTALPKEIQNNHQGLLSPRIYSGVLKPQSFLITNFEPLKDKMEEYIQENRINVSIYVENLRNGAQIGINEDVGMYPASLNKLPVAILIMDKIERGELSFQTIIQINESDLRDSQSELYKNKITKASVQTLFEKMLKDSDNTAFYALLRNINEHDLEILLNYYSLDPKSTYLAPNKYNKSPNLVSAVELSNIFTSLYLSTLLQSNSSEYILSLLTNNIFNLTKIALLPEDVKVAQKFGAYYVGDIKFFHDCGIMYSGETRLLYCIMTNDLDQQEAINVIGTLVHAINAYSNATREDLDTFKRQGSISLVTKV